MKAATFTTLALLAAHTSGAVAQISQDQRDKLADDPTKIITKVGVRYSDFGTVFGSLAFGPATKLNASVSEDEQWSIGGSYLFSFGIVNVAASRRQLDTGITQEQVSIGTFVPLSVLGVEPAGWQLFPAAGANYTEGSVPSTSIDFGDSLPFEVSSKGAYLGLLALRPMSEDWVFKTAAVGSAGSDDYSGYSLGAGLTYTVTPVDSVSVFGSYIDNSFGQRDLLGISYTREF